MLSNSHSSLNVTLKNVQSNEQGWVLLTFRTTSTSVPSMVPPTILPKDKSSVQIYGIYLCHVCYVCQQQQDAAHERSTVGCLSDDGGLVKQSYLGVDFVTPTYFPPHSSTLIRSAYWTNMSLIESQSGSENPESVSTSHDSCYCSIDQFKHKDLTSSNWSVHSVHCRRRKKQLWTGHIQMIHLHDLYSSQVQLSSAKTMFPKRTTITAIKHFNIWNMDWLNSGEQMSSRIWVLFTSDGQVRWADACGPQLQEQGCCSKLFWWTAE